MQDSYTGDVGDFGKYGLLRALCSDDEKRKFKMGINWYLVPDMGNPGDGGFTDYVQLKGCDRELYKKLSTMLNQKDKIDPSNEDNVRRLICIHIDCIGRESPELCNKRRCIIK